MISIETITREAKDICNIEDRVRKNMSSWACILKSEANGGGSMISILQPLVIPYSSQIITRSY